MIVSKGAVLNIRCLLQWGTVALLALSTKCVDASAQEPAPSGKWYENILVNGFLSTSYSYNFNRPSDRKNQLRVFDAQDNSFTVDVMELSLKKDVQAPGDAGFRFDLTAGSSIPKVARSGGLNSGDLDFHQMFLSYVVPAGKGLRLDFGKFITHLGYEVIEGYDGYNDNETHSFLFGYAIAFAHTGVRATYPFSDVLSASFMLTNGWDNAIDNNNSKTLCGQIVINPLQGLSLFANAAYGPERDTNNSDNRLILDFVGTYDASPNVRVGVNADYGSEQHATALGEKATWVGVAGYLRVNLLDQFSLCLRVEQFEDGEGVRTGTAQRLREVTITPEYRPTGDFIVRGDIRMDDSNNAVFMRQKGFVETQETVSLNMLYLY